jgi:tripartite-type tricarboxylate transporter receptor subunit TctC
MKVFRREFLLLGGSAVAAAIGSSAWAQAYPARPVRVIVPFGPGGPTDVFARLMAQKLSEQTGTQFYIENIGGAGGNIGATRASQAAPDGYTLLVDGANLVVNPALYPHVAYDPLKDFDPVTIAVTAPAILTVHPSVPAKTVKDLVALIKANAGKYSYASPGTGTPPHLVGELFRLSLGLDLVHVPFNGGGLAIASTVAGHTPISFGSMPPAVPLVKDDTLRALAVTTKSRSHALPDVPTMAEAGYPEVAGESWFVVVVPAGAAAEIIALLHR